MERSLRCVLGYALRPGEDLKVVTTRVGATGAGRSLSDAVIELPVRIDLTQQASAKASSFSATEIGKQFPKAQITTSSSGGISTWRVATDEETFDITVRGDRIYLTTFDGYGGFDELREQTLAQCLKRAYEAYRAVLAARAL